MKLRTFFMMAAAVAMVAAGCKKDNPSSVSLKVSPEALTFEAAGGSQSLSVVTTADWKVTGNSHFTLDKTSGKGASSVTVTAPAANSNDTVEETLTFTAGDKTVTVKLTQKGAGAPEDAISADPTTLDFEAEAASKSVAVTASGEWKWEWNADWISVVGNTVGIEVAVKDNNGDARTADIILTCGSKTVTVTVNQAAAAGPLTKIKNADDFLTFISIIKEYPEGTVVEFANDIDFTGVTGIPYVSIPATVTLDGKGFAVKNWDNAGAPLFKDNSGTIQNLILDSSCTITYDVTIGNKTQFGILLGQNYGTVKNCTNKANISFTDFVAAKTTHWGVFVGINRHIFDGCVNEGNVTITNLTGAGQFRLGGLIGSLAESTDYPSIIVTNCVNKGKLTVTRGDAKESYIGGIAGYYDSYPADHETLNAYLDGCVNEGAITINCPEGMTDGYVAGIAGMFRGGTLINSKNFGTITSTAGAGGIVGLINKNKPEGIITLDGCANNAEINGTAAEAGLVFANAVAGFPIILGTEVAPIKVAGKLNGTAVAEGNFSTMLYGTGVVLGEGSTVNAKFEAVSK